MVDSVKSIYQILSYSIYIFFFKNFVLSLKYLELIFMCYGWS